VLIAGAGYYSQWSLGLVAAGVLLAWVRHATKSRGSYFTRNRGGGSRGIEGGGIRKSSSTPNHLEDVFHHPNEG
jgi:hypothetical protein